MTVTVNQKCLDLACSRLRPCGRKSNGSRYRYSQVRVRYDAVKSRLSHDLLSLTSSLEHVGATGGEAKNAKMRHFSGGGTGWGQTDPKLWMILSLLIITHTSLTV